MRRPEEQLGAGEAAPAVALAARDRTLRVMSANLWAGAADAAAVADLLAARDVDVFAAQEASPEQCESIRSVLPHVHLEPAYREDRDDGNALALRREGQIETVPLVFRNGARSVLLPEVWPQLGRPLEVMSLHIAAPHTNVPVGLLVHRRKQVESLERHLIDGEQGAEGPDDGGDPPARVWLGDYNATPLWGVYRRLARRMTDAAIEAGQRNGHALAGTWGPWHGSRRLLRIDHAFVRDVRVERFEVVPVPGSDHSAILADLHVPPRD